MSLELVSKFRANFIKIALLACALNISCAWGSLRISNYYEKTGTFTSSQDGGYWWDNQGQNDGTNNTGDRGLTIQVQTSELRAGFDAAYVPYTGNYKMRVRWCPLESVSVSARSRCTIAESVGFYDSQTVALNSKDPLVNQDAHFLLTVGAKIPSKSSICYTFVDDEGVEWSTPAQRTCQDGGQLPEEAADCYLNSNVDMNIDLGILERSEIATTPKYDASGSIKREFPVLCIRDSGVTVETTFQFTPITVSGNEVISTSSANLGVAIFYEGKLVSPSSTPIVETFTNGYTYRELAFQAVRNPDVALKEVSTGDFTASAVMVMTEL